MITTDNFSKEVVTLFDKYKETKDVDDLNELLWVILPLHEPELVVILKILKGLDSEAFKKNAPKCRAVWQRIYDKTKTLVDGLSNDIVISNNVVIKDESIDNCVFSCTFYYSKSSGRLEYKEMILGWINNRLKYRNMIGYEL